MNTVIIVGQDHYNTLGLVRSLGENGIKPIVVIIACDAKTSFVLKSKYVKAGFIFEDASTKVIDFIVNNWYNKDYPSVVIGSSDTACTLIDANLSKLKGFICANCNQQENGVVSLMDKYTMNQQAAACGFEVPQSVLLKKEDKLNVEAIQLPCIVKPLESSHGNKNDIAICYTQDELKSAYAVFESQKIDILIQDFIQADYEIGIMGCSFYNSGDIWIPDVIYKKRYSQKSAVYAEVEPIQNHQKLAKIVVTIKKLINTIGYKGIFDVDLLCSGEHIYFIEMNMRNGAYGYGLSRAGSNFAHSWVMEATGHPIKVNELSKPTSIMIEFSDLIKIRENKVSFFRWLSEYRKSSHMIMQWADIKPVLSYLFARLKRI